MKKNWLKALATMTALMLTITACAGGTKKAETKDEKAPEGAKTEAAGKLKGEITVQAEKDWMPYYEAAAERVKKANPDVKIELKEVGAFEHLDVLDATDASNPDIADLFAIPADRLHVLAEKEVLAKIDSEKLAKEIGGWDKFNEGIGGNLKVGEEYLAFPYNIETLITFVNTKNAEAKGIDHTKPIEVTDQKEAGIVLLPLFDAWYGVAATNSSEIELLGKKDDKLFSDLTEEYAKLPADKKATIDAIYDYWKMNADAKTPLFDADAGWGYIDETFTTGKSGVARLGGPWDTATISKLAGEGNLEIYPVSQITLKGKALNHWQGGWGLAINSRIEEDKDKYAVAEAMIKEIVNPEFAIDLFKATGKILENVPFEKYKESDLTDTEKKVVSAVIESYKKAPARPLFKEWSKVWDTWKNATLSWNSVAPQSAEDAYKELKASFDSMMTNFN